MSPPRDPLRQSNPGLGRRPSQPSFPAHRGSALDSEEAERVWARLAESHEERTLMSDRLKVVEDQVIEVRDEQREQRKLLDELVKGQTAILLAQSEDRAKNAERFASIAMRFGAGIGGGATLGGGAALVIVPLIEQAIRWFTH